LPGALWYSDRKSSNARAGGEKDRGRASLMDFSGQQNTNTFIGTITAAVSPDRFFAPENIERILSANVAGQNTLGPD
jgi:hypothetical protein